MNFSRLSKLFLLHAVSLAVVAGAATYLVAEHLVAPETAFEYQALQLFFGIYCLGALVLGAGSVIRPTVLVVNKLLKAEDLNDNLVREEIEILIFYVGEILLSLAALTFGGFLRFGLFHAPA